MGASLLEDISNFPVYTRAHVAIGITGIFFGSLALALRTPAVLLATLKLILGRFRPTLQVPQQVDRLVNFLLRFHAPAGGVFVVAYICMPLTSNWIWPRLGTPLEIIYLIWAAFACLALGIISIRLYLWVNADAIAAERVLSKGLVLLPPREGTTECGARAPAAFGPSSEVPIPSRRHAWLKVLHSGFMIFAFGALVGGAQAFLGNARTHEWPYKQRASDPADQALTDSLVGRCVGRRLQDPALPSWLNNLDCGYGPVCAESSEGGVNPYSRSWG